MGRGAAFPVFRHTIDAARTQLDDLQSEMEAGARQVQKIVRRAEQLDLVARHEHAASELQTRMSDLRLSLRQQRELMLRLRLSLNDLRRHAGRRGETTP
jgi:hypothetical protein